MKRSIPKAGLLFALALTLSLPLSAKQKGIYLFGVTTNLKDSTSCITSVQYLEGVTLGKGSGFLTGRSLYSAQLKSYTESLLGHQHDVAAVFFDENKAKVEKKRHKVLRNLKKDKDIHLKEIDPDAFRFTTVSKEKLIEQGHE